MKKTYCSTIKKSILVLFLLLFFIDSINALRPSRLRAGAEVITTGLDVSATATLLVNHTGSFASVAFEIQATSTAILKVFAPGHWLVVPMTTTVRDSITAENGMIIYNSTANIFEMYQASAWGALEIQDPELRGMSLQQSSLTLILDTGIIYLDFEASGTGDITYLLDGEELVLDCTTGDGVGGKARVALVSGADLSTVSENFVVVRNIGGVASVVNHLTRPLGSFAWVGVFVLPDNSTFSTTGAYSSQRYTDSLLNDLRGALSHEREKTRFAGADYFSGVLPTVTILTDPSPDEVTISTESGEAYQLHRLPFPAFTGSATLFIANDPSTPFTTVTDLNGVLTDAAGDSLTNKRYVHTLWASINAFDSKLFINLPNGSYSSDSEALADSDNTAVTTVPNEFRQTAFLIAKIVLRHQSAGGGTFTLVGIVDLRGQRPGFNVGSVSGSSSNSDALFEIRDNADDTKIMKFEVSGITTGNTRIYTVPDLGGTLALISDLTVTASPTALDTAEIDTTVSASNQISGDLIDDSIAEPRLKIFNAPQDYFILTASSTTSGGWYWASGTSDLGFITSFTDTNTITTSSTFELNNGGSDGPGNLNIIAAGALSGAKTGSGASITFTLSVNNLLSIWDANKLKGQIIGGASFTAIQWPAYSSTATTFLPYKIIAGTNITFNLSEDSSSGTIAINSAGGGGGGTVTRSAYFTTISVVPLSANQQAVNSDSTRSHIFQGDVSEDQGVDFGDLMLPVIYDSGDVTVKFRIFTPTAESGKDAIFHVKYLVIENADEAWAIGSYTAIASQTESIANQTTMQIFSATIPAAEVSDNCMINLHIFRLDADAADTFVGHIHINQAWIEFLATQ